MLKRPSTRSKSNKEALELNLVPMLDALVTMVAFLLYSISFLSFVSIESPAPVAATKEIQKKLDEKPLQLTVSVRKTETEIWSPFERIKRAVIPHTDEKKPNTRGIHEFLLTVKQKFPNETKIVFVPYSEASYDLLIEVMDALRLIEPTDPPIYSKDQSGTDQLVKFLFPEIVFGNLLGES